jgi:hypothetical protein
MYHLQPSPRNGVVFDLDAVKPPSACLTAVEHIDIPRQPSFNRVKFDVGTGGHLPHYPADLTLALR